MRLSCSCEAGLVGTAPWLLSPAHVQSSEKGSSKHCFLWPNCSAIASCSQHHTRLDVIEDAITDNHLCKTMLSNPTNAAESSSASVVCSIHAIIGDQIQTSSIDFTTCAAVLHV